MHWPDSQTRREILDAALKRFAHCGYAATSVQDIVSAARVSKPALYYYFPDKAGLYQALVDRAHDERYRLMRAATRRGATLAEQLEEILAALFEFLQENRELMRIAFATAFAAPGELPAQVTGLDKSLRNFEFIHGLMKRAVRDGLLDPRFGSRELAFGFYGHLNIYVMAHLLLPDCQLDRARARQIVSLFLAGAAAKKKTAAVPRPRRPRRPRSA